MVLISFAGTPPTTVIFGTSFVTTAPAAITAQLPIVTPGKTVAFEPIQTFLPIVIFIWAAARPKLFIQLQR